MVSWLVSWFNESGVFILIFVCFSWWVNWIDWGVWRWFFWSKLGLVNRLVGCLLKIRFFWFNINICWVKWVIWFIWWVIIRIVIFCWCSFFIRVKSFFWLVGLSFVVGLLRIKMLGFIVKIFVKVICCICFFESFKGLCCKWFVGKLRVVKVWLVVCLVFLVFFFRFWGLKVMFLIMVGVKSCFFGNWKIYFIWWWMLIRFFLVVWELMVKLLIWIDLLVGKIRVFIICISVDLLFLVWLIMVVVVLLGMVVFRLIIVWVFCLLVFWYW